MRPTAPTLESVYRSELKAVHAFLWRLGAQPAEMEDLAHDVFVTAARRWSSFDPSRAARPWLLGITFRVFSDARRKRVAIATDQLSTSVPDTARPPDETVALNQAQRLLLAALDELPEERRVAFVLHELQGLSVAEVSEAMESPVPTTYSRLKVAREEVAAAVQRRLQAKPTAGLTP